MRASSGRRPTGRCRGRWCAHARLLLWLIPHVGNGNCNALLRRRSSLCQVSSEPL